MEATTKGISLPISSKQSMEICAFLRGKTTEKAKKLLEQVLEKKIAVPYRRFNEGVGHRKGKIAAGRFPINSTSEILKLLKSAEANAEVKGMSSPLVIKEMIANQASRSWHFGRHRRIKTKRTHINIVLEETKVKNNKTVHKKSTNKSETK